MSALSGVSVIGDYTADATAGAAIAKLLALIPNPDAPHGTGAVAGGGQGQTNTYLDEMSPGAAAQLRAELIALKAEVNLFEAP